MPILQEIEEFVRQKCIEANPEIVELKFGCELRGQMVKGDDHDFWYGPFLWIGGTRNAVVNSEGGPVVLKDGYDVIGRPLKLADILLAMQKALKGSLNHDLFISGIILENSSTLGKTWNLHLDWSDQSEDLKRFVYQLLK